MRDLRSFDASLLLDSSALSILNELCAISPERQRGSTVEQLICNQWVAGSIPVAGSIEISRSECVCALACLFLDRECQKLRYGHAQHKMGDET